MNEAAGPRLSRDGGRAYDAAGKRGLDIAAANGVELITLSDAEVQRFKDAMAPAIAGFMKSTLRDGLTGADVVQAMGGLGQ